MCGNDHRWRDLFGLRCRAERGQHRRGSPEPLLPYCRSRNQGTSDGRSGTPTTIPRCPRVDQRIAGRRRFAARLANRGPPSVMAPSVFVVAASGRVQRAPRSRPGIRLRPAPASAGRARLGPADPALHCPCPARHRGLVRLHRIQRAGAGRRRHGCHAVPAAHWALGDGVAPDLARIDADFPVFSILGRQLEEGIGQMTAAESFDAGIARQIGHYADAVPGTCRATTRSSSPGHQGLPRTAHCRAA